MWDKGQVRSSVITLSLSLSTKTVSQYFETTAVVEGQRRCLSPSGPGFIPGRISVLVQVFSSTVRQMLGNLGHIIVSGYHNLKLQYVICLRMATRRSLTLAVIHGRR